MFFIMQIASVLRFINLLTLHLFSLFPTTTPVFSIFTYRESINKIQLPVNADSIEAGFYIEIHTRAGLSAGG